MTTHQATTILAEFLTGFFLVGGAALLILFS